MKRFKQYLTAIFLLVIAAGCSKDLNTTPYRYVDVSQALNTSNDIQVALVGAYHDLSGASGGLLGGESILEADLLGDDGDIKWKGTYQEFTDMKNKQITINNFYVANTWLQAYQVINDVNNILSVLDKADTADRSRIEGECKFIRGLAYFIIIRMYGKDYNDGDPATNLGVPIVLTPTTQVNDSSQVPRSTVKEVYTQIISDLKTAELNLPEDNGVYATTYAASAFLSRVYLQQADYQNALTESDRVIESGVFELTDTYSDEFLGGYDPNNPAHIDNTSEDIFAIQITPTSGVNALNEFYAPGSYGGRGEALVTSDHIAKYEAGDDRLNLIDGNYTSKFYNVYGNIHVIRLAEMYLIRAEANFRLGSSVGASAQDDINLIRERVLLPDLTSGEVTLDKILHERYLELAFEDGFFLYDRKRLQQPVGPLAYNDPSLLFPIPQREMIANKNLTQNEGYH